MSDEELKQAAIKHIEESLFPPMLLVNTDWDSQHHLERCRDIDFMEQMIKQPDPRLVETSEKHMANNDLRTVEALVQEWML